MSAYLLSLGGLLLLGGRIADLLGRRVFVTGTLLFGPSSLLCGFAGTATTLIATRAVQGVSAAVMTPTDSRSAAPRVPLRLLRSRTVSGANLVVFLLGATAFGMSYPLSRYGQGVLGWSPLRLGLANVVMPLGAVVGSYAGQALVTRVGARPVAVAGLSASALAALLLSGVPVNGGFVRDLLPALLLFGQTAAFQIGGGFGVAVATSATVSHTMGPDRLTAPHLRRHRGPHRRGRTAARCGPSPAPRT
ncbi:hypothetical protein ACI2L1_40555 [Streptomyces sp. NPDC019531]|uniref:hypothetical protein n=1 Tax=Streptomyces sp. NPDC019531 TaxID=3365062 RepID=UPI00385055CB